MAEQVAEPTVVPISPTVAGAMAQDGHEIDAAPAAVDHDPATVHDAGPKASGDMENDPAASGQQGAQRDDGQPPVRVKDIRVGNKDGRGLAITYIYATQADEYSIYQAG